MIYPQDDDVLIVWDYAVPVVGAAAALVMAGAMYAIRRTQAAREQDFGESLRIDCGVVSRSSTTGDEELRLTVVGAVAAAICGWPSTSPAAGSRTWPQRRWPVCSA